MSATLTMRERRRLEHRGLDEDGLAVYREEVYEERRKARRERVQFAGWYERVPELLAVLDQLTAWGEPDAITRMRAWIGDDPPSCDSTSGGPPLGQRELCAYARGYAHTPLLSPLFSLKERKEGEEEEEASDNARVCGVAVVA